MDSIDTINPHRGQDFDDFLKEEGIYECVYAAAQKKILAIKAARGRKRKSVSKRNPAAKYAKSRTAKTPKRA